MIRDEELEGLISLYQRGDLEEELAALVERRVQESPDAAALLASFQRLDELCAGDGEDDVPEQVSRRVLAELHAALEAPESAGEGGSGPEIMTREEVARFLRLGEDELGELIAELPFFELGGRLRMRRERLVEWIEEREKRSRLQRFYSVGGGRRS